MAFQDMPPPGGFGSINVERTFARPLIRRGIYAAILIGMSINGIIYIRGWKKKYKILKLEQAEHYIATSPFLLAETERKFLLRLRYLREDERELMKDHEHWKLGTLYGEPVWKTVPENQIPPISPIEFVAGRSDGEWFSRVVVPDSHQ